MSNLNERLLSLIKAYTQEGRKYKELEEQTGVPADRWKAFALGRQRPTSEMIEGAFKRWPKHAFWLGTGAQDDKYGHTAPEGFGYPQAAPIDSQDATKIYFEKLVQTQSELADMNASFTNSIRPLGVDQSQDEIKVDRLREILELHSEIRWVDILLKTYVPEFGSKELEFVLRLVGHKINAYEKEAIRLGEATPESVRLKAKEMIRQYEKLLEWMKERDESK
jgi:hypothetical protein